MIPLIKTLVEFWFNEQIAQSAKMKNTLSEQEDQWTLIQAPIWISTRNWLHQQLPKPNLRPEVFQNRSWSRLCAIIASSRMPPFYFWIKVNHWTTTYQGNNILTFQSNVFSELRFNIILSAFIEGYYKKCPFEGCSVLSEDQSWRHHPVYYLMPLRWRFIWHFSC